jgi:hypothetical protein
MTRELYIDDVRVPYIPDQPLFFVVRERKFVVSRMSETSSNNVDSEQNRDSVS